MQHPRDIDISLCIVNFNTKDALERCLRSVSKQVRPPSAEILVVDNGSADGSADMVARHFPHVQLFRNHRNRGFARAANQAMRASRGRFLLLANPDIVVPAGTIETLYRHITADSGISILGCRLEDASGNTMGSCGYFPSTATLLIRHTAADKLLRKNRRIREALRLDYFAFPEETTAVDCVIGAFILVRRAAVEEVGLLDEDFFLYGEDLDWCRRMLDRGWKVVYLPEASVYHEQGRSADLRPLSSLWHFHTAMYKFYRKHQVKQVPLPLRGVVPLGISLKFCLALARHALGVRGGGRVYRTVRAPEKAPVRRESAT